ncbi:MAG: hypothetical protein CVT67_04925 [Actinobacteria bacterium HGW-Actinobacteria-7]|nr:MAG: hypothetical protein CVT67_04925 [Actinobacteria bacterium HGW-Actinobacteria-7]
MNIRKGMALGAAGLALGLVIGGISTASAVTATTAGTASANPVVAGACGLGLRLGQAVRDSGGRLADVVAKLTGMDVADVQTQRQAGASFADIAKDKGVSATELVKDALDTRKDMLDAKVKDGTITQDQADTALATMETRLTDRVSSTAPGGNGGGMGRGRGGAGGGGGRGMGGGGCGGTCTTAPVTQ